MLQLESKPERQSQVASQINVLERELPQLYDVIDSLSERLVSVLRQPSSLDKEVKGEDSEELVILAGTIRGFENSIKLARRKIEDLLDRLEL